MDRALPASVRDHPGLTLAYRPNVAAIIRDLEGRILWCERISPRGVWQFPQGGIDPGETAEEALWRELSEELGIGTPQACLTIEARRDEPLRYDLPVAVIERFLQSQGFSYIGQSQQYFLLRFDGDDRWITLEPPEGEHREFVRFVWSDTRYLAQSAPFKLRVMRRALAEFGLL